MMMLLFIIVGVVVAFISTLSVLTIIFEYICVFCDVIIYVRAHRASFGDSGPLGLVLPL